MTMTFQQDVQPALTKEQYHRLRDLETNGDAPTNGDTPVDYPNNRADGSVPPPVAPPEVRSCEMCGGSLSPSQTRFCSKPCAARGVSRDRKLAAKKPPADVDQALEFKNPAGTDLGLLVAQLLVVVQVREIEMQFSGVHLTVRTKEA